MPAAEDRTEGLVIDGSIGIKVNDVGEIEKLFTLVRITFGL